MPSLTDYATNSAVPAAWISGSANVVSNSDNGLAQHAGDLGIILATDQSTSCGPTPPDAIASIDFIKYDLTKVEKTPPENLVLSDVALTVAIDIVEENASGTLLEESSYTNHASLCPRPILICMTDVPPS